MSTLFVHVRRPLLRVSLSLCLCLTGISTVGAWETEQDLFRLETNKELVILGTGLLFNAGACLLEDNESYDPRDAYDARSVNAVDRRAMTAYSARLDDLSAGFTLSALLSPAVLVTTSRSEWLSIGTMYAESLFLTWGFKELGKTLFPRDRPYMHFSEPPAKEIEQGDFRRSFPSGHTAMAFTAASFSSYVFNQYCPDSQWRVPVSVISYSLAVGSGALRVASGNHYLSDVLVGAAVGTASGLIVPWLHRNIPAPTSHASDDQSISVSLTPVGFMLSYSY